MTTTTENVRLWSVTTGTANAAVDAGIASSDSQPPDTVDNNVRSIMTSVRRESDDRGGAIVAAGTANAITVTTASGLASGHIAAGLSLRFRATATNTSAVTLAPDGLSAVAVVDALGRELTGGEIQSGAMVGVVYNANTSKWQLVSGFPTPGMFLLASGAASGATLDIVLTNYTAYRGLKFVLTKFLPATNAAALWMRISTNAGGAYATVNYHYGRTELSDAGTSSSAGSTNAGAFILANSLSSGNSNCDAEITLYNQAATEYPRIMFRVVYLSSGSAHISTSGGGLYDAAAQDTDAVRFMFSSGNITSGNYAVYGLI